VTDVRMSENLREARVYVTVEGDEVEGAQAMRALNHAAPYVRRQLATSLSLRRAPQIFFVRDTVEERANRVDQLLDHLAHAPPAAGETAAGERGDDEMMNAE